MKRKIRKSVKTMLLSGCCMILAMLLVTHPAAVLPGAAAVASPDHLDGTNSTNADKSVQNDQGGEDASPANPDGTKDPDEEDAGQKDPDEGDASPANPDGTKDPDEGNAGQKDPGEEDLPQQGDEDPAPVEPDGPDSEKKTSISVTVSLNKKDFALLQWKRVKGAVTYTVERKKEGNQSFHKLADIEKDKHSYIDAHVKRGNQYDYRVVAVMEDSSKVYSKSVSFSCPLAQVSDVRLIRYSTSSIKVVWEKSKDKKVAYYRVYYGKSNTAPDSFQLAASTKNNWYRIKNLKIDQDYSFYVKAGATKKRSKTDSAASKVVKMRTKPYERLTIFAGDSITSGLADYHVLNEIGIGGHKSVLAAVGLNTTTFRTRRTFAGQTAVQSIISSKPYRVYLMLGVNDIHYRTIADLIDGYQEILRSIRASSPDTDIVIQAVSPVTLEKVKESSGFAQIPEYNRQLEKLAQDFGVRYCDCTGFLKDSTGWLNHSYSAGDGYHWTISAYHKYAKLLEAYDQSLD